MSPQSKPSNTDNRDKALRTILKSQYHAALAMLRETIEECPDDVWLRTDQRNSFWQIAYHTLYFTHLYMQPNKASFQPWQHHQADVQHPDGIPDPPDPRSQFLSSSDSESLHEGRSSGLLECL